MSAEALKKQHRHAVTAFFFLFGFCFASWASRIPAIQQNLHLNEATLGLVLFALPAGLFVSLPIAGFLVAKYGSRTVLACSASAYAFILVAIGLAHSTMQLAIILFCFGLAGNMANISLNTQAVGVEALYKRSIMATFHGIWSLAGFAGAALGTAMVATAIVPSIHFSAVCTIAIVMLLLSFRYLLPADVKTADTQPLFAWPDKSLLTLGLIAFCSMICEGAMFDWSGVYFKKVVQVKASLVGAGYTAFMCTMAASRFVADYFTTRLGFKRVIQISGLFTTSGLLLAVALPGFVTAIIGFLLVGIGVSSIVPLVYSAAGRSSTMSPGVALAAVSTIGFLGFLFGPPAIGLLASISSLRLSFSVIALMGLSVTLLVTFSSYSTRKIN